MRQETWECQNCQNSFTIEPEDFNFYEKIKVPPPTFCPQCRMVRRMIWWNYRMLFRRSDVNGVELFSMFPPDVPLKIYERDFWWSDGWDPMEYGRDYDFSRPFFEQFRELMHDVPWPSRSAVNLKNSPYVSNCADVKNSYLCFAGSYLENSAYVVFFNNVKEGFDLIESRHSELCYDCYMVDEAYRVFYSVNCESCTDVWFSRNLFGCTNCFGCVNLRNKSYHIFNKPVSKEEYKEFMKQFASGSHSTVAEMKKKAHEFWVAHPMRFTLAINVVNSTGEHIERTKNVRDSYSIHESENLRHCQFLASANDSYDFTRIGPASFVYEACVVGLGAERIHFSAYCFSGVNDIQYSLYCPGSSNLFGCVGLQKKQYCILNKRYPKEEYFALREKIIKHMNEMPYISVTRHVTGDKKLVYKYGEFFPPEFSPFAYNETLASDFAPLTKEEVERRGYLWREPAKREYRATINAADLPDHISDIGDTVTDEIIKCSSCGEAYRIIPMELQFYRRIGLPLPRLCVECRFRERFKFVNPPKFWHAKCHCMGETSDTRHATGKRYRNTAVHFHGGNPCPSEFETSYNPDRPEIVYCEQCYQVETV